MKTELFLSFVILVSSQAFRDDFKTLNLSLWDPSNSPSPLGGINNDGVFIPSRVSVVDNEYLQLHLTQVNQSSGIINSTGGEVYSTFKLGYGAYEWRARLASNSSDPMGTSSGSFSGCISGLFNFLSGNDSSISITEIDIELEGQYQNNLEFTSFKDGKSVDTTQVYVNSSVDVTSDFHVYKFIWMEGLIEFYYDGEYFANITQYVPKEEAFVVMNLWGTNYVDFGGVATPDVDRFLYIDYFMFTPLENSTTTTTASTSTSASNPTSGSASVTSSTSNKGEPSDSATSNLKIGMWVIALCFVVATSL